MCVLSYDLISRFFLLWPWPGPDVLDIRTWPRYSEGMPTCMPEMKFLGQGFRKLEHAQDRQTDKQTRANALTGRIRGWNKHSCCVFIVNKNRKVARIENFLLITLVLIFKNILVVQTVQTPDDQERPHIIKHKFAFQSKADQLQMSVFRCARISL